MTVRPIASSALASDAAIERVSYFLRDPPAGLRRVGIAVAISTRIATNVLVVEASLLTIVIADTTAPMLPIPQKLVAYAAAALAIVSLAAATTGIAVNLTELAVLVDDASGGRKSEDLEQIVDTLELFADPLSTLVEGVIVALGRLKVLDADAAMFTKLAKDYRDARQDRLKAIGPAAKSKAALKEIGAAKKLIEKLVPMFNDNGDAPDWSMDKRNQPWPKGVDAPNMPPPSHVGPNPGPIVA
jgi:hypothetical protein